MKAKLKKAVVVAAAVAGVFLAATLLIFALSLSSSLSEKSPIVGALIVGAVIAAASLPVFAWFAMKPPSLDSYSGFALEELELDEDELFDAVSNWVFVKHKRRAEHPVRFLEDDDGNVGCRVSVRKD